ncbi:type I endonuclease-methyltransferase fusion protein [Spirochaetia bacterium]|nr:type I endonuclease-methyltransferase fusion protein [Spirochaetia bacterium]
MADTLFKSDIKKLKFTSFKKEVGTGVFFTEGFEQLKQDEVSPDVLFAIETAEKKYKADAVYFRTLPGSQEAVPQIYIFDNTDGKIDKKIKNELHKQMWNGYQVPIYIIIEKSSVSIFDSRKKPQTNKENYAEEMIRLVGNEISNFNAKDFDNGLFWELQEKNNFKFEESATKDLIRGLKAVYKKFQEESKLDKHVALKLLVQSLLIKYLEERDEIDENGYFTKNYFKEHFQSDNFCKIIRDGKLLDLLDKLSSDFNGKIFFWENELDTDKETRESIRKTEVTCLAKYLDGNIDNNQFVLWRLYSFSHLPIEVISSVYEELLTNSKDIVYTPEMIVNLMIDECMPIKTPIDNFKMIDVSCGSGIFLVKAYKRIVQWWRYKEWKKTGRLKKPSFETLKGLLETSIHGIDIQPDAINLARFSLVLAMLDEVVLDPPTWDNLEFPDLSKTIFQQNFFIYISNIYETDYDLVIGNPPFNLPPDDNGEEPARKDYFLKLKNDCGYKSEITIPDENPALHFLIQSMKLLKPNAMLCLIQPAGPFIYRNEKFKHSLFSRYNLLQVIDFTKLAGILWGKKDVSAATVFLQNASPNDDNVAHIIANRLSSNLNRIFLEFDYYDFYYMDKFSIINKPYTWRANLAGGGRIVLLLERLLKLRKLKHFLDDKRKKNHWKYAEGYTVGGKNSKKKPANYIYGKTRIKPDWFTEEGIIKTDIETEKCFKAPCKESKEIFISPHILIKKDIGKINNIPIAFPQYDAVFSKRIIGIHAPRNEIDTLKDLYDTLEKNKSFLYRFFIAITSSEFIINHATTILKKDIDDLPFPDNKEDLIISEAEKILIDDVLSFQFKKNGATKLNISSKPENIKCYSKIFCKTLNSMYQKEERSFQTLEIIDSGSYYIVHFVYSNMKINPEHKSAESLEQYINNSTFSNKNVNYHIQKIIKLYGQDSIILVKPKQMRYWLKSIALRDADEIFTDYIKVRYQNAER